MPLLGTKRLILRNWRDEDRPVMHRLNSDEQTMKYFPFRLNRIEATMRMEAVRNRIADKGYGLAVVEIRATGEVAGFTGIADFEADVPFAPAVEIGWRFLPEFWGNGYATEAARSWLQYGFDVVGLDRIVAFAVPQNTASTAVMQRLGMEYLPDQDFDHPAVSAEYPHLKKHVLYAITKEQFVARQ